jgi:hypothetical protein
MNYKIKGVNNKLVRTISLFILIGGLILVLYWAINPERSPEWTGFSKYNDINYRTLWDWLDLIIIPGSIGLFAWVFTSYEKDKSKRIENEKFKDVTLDSFMKVMAELIINNDLPGSPNQKSLAIAKTRMNIALDHLDGTRKGQVLQFLYQSNLIDKHPNLKLQGANFNDTIIDNIVLIDAEIRGAYFENASLLDTNLNGSILNSCNFKNADFSNSKMNHTDLAYTDLTNAKLRNVDLTSIEFEGAILTNADLEGSKITQSQLNNIFSKEGIKLTKTNII